VSKNMAAVTDSGEVLNIIVCHDDEPETPNLITYTDNNPAYIGGDYVDGYFYPPQPFASWTRSEGEWLPPTPKPEGLGWFWNEDEGEWQQPDIS
jgi:hypothetical protein